MNLQSKVEKVPKIGISMAKRLEKLGIETIEDLLLHVPFRYDDFRVLSKIDKVRPGQRVTIKGKVIASKNTFTRRFKNFQTIDVLDETGEIQIVFFNQSFIVKNFKEGDEYFFSGTVGEFSHKKALIAPSYEKVTDAPIHTAALVPIYPETYGVSSKWLRGRLKYLTENLDFLETNDHLPDKFLAEYNLTGLTYALLNIHFPKNLEDERAARYRLAFDELLQIHLKTLSKKSDWQKTSPVHKLKVDKKEVAKFTGSLPFKLTDSQEKTIEEILSDMERNYPMNRLLEGDVGSGKTLVAAAACFAAFLGGYQSVIMAPTQILAIQHYKTLDKLFEKFKIRTSLVTGSTTKSDMGRCDIFIGTHALIHRKLNFDKVALVVVDEQHRFGVEQRSHLIKITKKGKIAPHVLTMTATPIPRTIALTAYGDLDLSVLNEMPKGRIPITTWSLKDNKRNGAFKWIDDQIEKDKIQVYYVCPLIEESDTETLKQVKAATTEFEKLKKIFPKRRLGLLHGKMKGEDKNKILDKFKEGKIDILVSTPVVEVGIDVANATIMVIEAANRFGLAQLHQLRGRVGRGSKKSYCLLFSEGVSKTSYQRLSAMEKGYSGFELAEIDLMLRGPGEVFGVKQHGFIDLKIASWQDSELIKTTKEAASRIIKNLDLYSLLEKKLNDIKNPN